MEDGGADAPARDGRRGRDETREERADRNFADILQELRVVLTGTQLISGFLLAVAFQSGFQELDAQEVAHYLVLVGIAALATLLGLTPVTLHRLHFAKRLKPQIVRRDDQSWLIDGVTPIQDVLRALDIDALPHPDEYETLAGFLMTMLRRVPKRTDSVTCAGHTFEVMDVDSHRIDQVMVTRLDPRPVHSA